MKINSFTQREWDGHKKDTKKIFPHFCILPRRMDDATWDNWRIFWFEYCYKVSVWNGHGAGGNRYFKYFEKLNSAKECMGEETLY